MMGYFQAQATGGVVRMKAVGDAAEATFGYVLEQEHNQWWKTPLSSLRTSNQDQDLEVLFPLAKRSTNRSQRNAG